MVSGSTPIISDSPSFPTRRSSDLHADDRDARRALGAHGAVRLAAEERRGVAAGKVVEDRKSTRLNSSHRCISYAVFCLKKKSERYRYAQARRRTRKIRARHLGDLP